jgi:hypothetical protein
MAYKIVNEYEPLEIMGIVVALYGEPGIGKTSLAFTCANPLLEDYDGGVKRCVGRKRFLKIERWEDAVEFHNSPEFKDMGIQTLVIDTAGTLLDNYIAQYCIKNDPKNARNGGELSLQGYGAMKSVFRQFVNSIQAQGIDLVFICHSEAQKEGDNIKHLPKMTGGSYDILIERADLLGFYESKGNKRTLNFNPTDRSVGKNTAEFDVIQVPHYTDPAYGTFLADLIAKTKLRMVSLSQEQTEVLRAIEEMKAKIESAGINELEAMLPEIETHKPAVQASIYGLADKRYTELLRNEIQVVSYPNEADAFYQGVNNYPERYKLTFKQLLWSHCKKVGLTFDKETGKFIKALEAAPVTDQAPAQAPTAEAPKATAKKTSKKTADVAVN